MYKICLVEDEVNLNNIVKTYLENAGYEVISFYDGKSALAYIGNEVNLWILDIIGLGVPITWVSAGLVGLLGVPGVVVVVVLKYVFNLI